MKIVLLSNDTNLLQEWNKKDNENELVVTENLEECKKFLKEHKEMIIIADYDSYASEINKLISSDQLCDNLIILEKIPEILTGKQLISHGIKAYGNSRMLKIHYKQMIQTVASHKIWTYPELTVALAQTTQKSKLSTEA
ncbi:MAG: DNA-binding response regulator, partial [Sulfurimonas sp.]